MTPFMIFYISSIILSIVFSLYLFRADASMLDEPTVEDIGIILLMLIIGLIPVLGLGFIGKVFYDFTKNKKVSEVWSVLIKGK